MEEATNHSSVEGECAAVAAHLHHWPGRAHLPRALLCALIHVRCRARQITNEGVMVVVRRGGEAQQQINARCGRRIEVQRKQHGVRAVDC